MSNTKFNIEKIEDSEINQRKPILLYIFLTIIVLFCLILLYSRYISTSIIKVNEKPIYTDKISENIDGFKIIHISDILYGSTILNNGLEKLVNKINILKPDIVVFTGDIISSDYEINNKNIDNIIKSLSNIESKYGKFAIRGDNDYKNDTFIEIMESSDFKYLDNNYDLIYINNNEYIFIGGINSSTKLNIDYTQLTSYQNDNIYKIMLMHEPNNIDDVKNNINPDLVLAGHTLLGQFRIPFVGGISYDKQNKKYTDEYYILDNTQMYISSGIGTLNYPFRFMNSPNINFYRIIKKSI